jgi:hypothetical protein
MNAEIPYIIIPIDIENNIDNEKHAQGDYIVFLRREPYANTLTLLLVFVI